jgi:hypothetical protein
MAACFRPLNDFRYLRRLSGTSTRIAGLPPRRQIHVACGAGSATAILWTLDNRYTFPTARQGGSGTRHVRKARGCRATAISFTFVVDPAADELIVLRIRLWPTAKKLPLTSRAVRGGFVTLISGTGA